jgi:hypothetical protein
VDNNEIKIWIFLFKKPVEQGKTTETRYEVVDYKNRNGILIKMMMGAQAILLPTSISFRDLFGYLFELTSK